MNPSLSALLSNENIVDRPITDGDAGIILRSDGSFHVFSTGKIDPLAITEAQMRQGELLLALSIPLTHPHVLEVLLNMARDPDIVGAGVAITAH